MVTYILMALGVAAVAALAGFTGGLASPPSRPVENKGIKPELELDSQAVEFDSVANLRPPKASRSDRIITAMAYAMVVLIGALGVLTFQVTTCGGGQPTLQRTVGSLFADGLLRSAQAMPAQADTALCDNHDAQAAAAPVAVAAMSQPSSHAAHAIRFMSKTAVGARKVAAAVRGSVASSDHGTWLYPPHAEGGG